MPTILKQNKNDMKKIILIATLGIMIAFSSNAQKQGYVNVQQLMLSLPTFEKAQKDVAAYAKTYEDVYNTMTQEYQTKVLAFQKAKGTMSDAVAEAKAADIQSLEKKITDYSESSNKKVSAKNEELMKPVYDKVNSSISEYASANGYDYVFAVEALLYAKDSDNLTDALIKKMGGKMTPSAAPKAAATPGK